MTTASTEEELEGNNPGRSSMRTTGRSMASSGVMATTVTSDDLGAARTSRIHAERRGGEARTGRIHAERRGGGEKKHAPATSMATTSPVTGRSTRAGTEEGRRG
jgi:hypothetical protein